MQESALINDIPLSQFFDTIFLYIIIGLCLIRSILVDLVNKLLNYFNQLIHTRVRRRGDRVQLRRRRSG